jgi:tetraacyldisaccharide 4'-kinase
MPFKRALYLAGSFAWSTGSLVARRMASAGVLSSEKLDSYVISVGNLQAGGSGKTPIVAMIAREAMSRSKSVCILTRGYGGAWERSGGIVKPGDPTLDARLVGDEVALLHDLAPGAWIAVGADRVTGSKEATRLHGRRFDVAILDDGFQHWKIKKDLEILALTSKLPGETVFRDFSSQLKNADLIVWTKGDVEPESLGDASSPWVKTRYRLNIPSGPLKEVSYWLVSAIGDAESFRTTVEAAGLKIEKEISFSDHHSYTAEQVSEITRQAREAGVKIAMTGKDWVKWRNVTPTQRASDASNDMKAVLVLEPELVFEAGREIWEKMLWS